METRTAEFLYPSTVPTTHIVRRGECLSSIAARYGFRDYRTIYEDGANAPLRALRPNPDVLYEGDTVVIPDKEERLEEGSTAKRHTFVTRTTGAFLRVQVEASRALDYDLVIDDGRKFEGRTDGKAPIVHPIARNAKTAVLRLWPTTMEERTDASACVRRLALGELDPIETTLGVQGRLLNLSFYPGPLDDQLGPATRAAVRAFEAFLGWPETGEITDPLRSELVARHDG